MGKAWFDGGLVEKPSRQFFGQGRAFEGGDPERVARLLDQRATWIN
jgi:hypothetical protein